MHWWGELRAEAGIVDSGSALLGKVRVIIFLLLWRKKRGKERTEQINTCLEPHLWKHLRTFFCLMVLLRYNSHTIKFTFLSMQFSVFSIFIVLGNCHHCVILEHFQYPQRKPWTLYQWLPTLPSSRVWQPLILFLFLRSCFSCPSHINENIQYVVFCNWLLSIMFQGSPMLLHILILHFFKIVE